MTEAQFRAQMNGLVTEPSRIIAGDGGFVKLDNAQCKSAGLVEPRGGLQLFMNVNASSSGELASPYARTWQSATWFASTDGTSTRMRLNAGGSTALTLAGYQPNIRSEGFADRQCWTFERCLRMLDTPQGGSAPFARLPGGPKASAPLCELVDFHPTDPRMLAYERMTAYRVVIARNVTTSAGDRVVYGAPSDRVLAMNDNQGVQQPCNVQVTVPIGFLNVGDEIQIYRAPLQSICKFTGGADFADPGDELILIHSYRIQATAATYVWTDDILDGEWSGPVIYTADSQDGILQSNLRPTRANDVAYYNGMAFYGGFSRGQTKTIGVLSAVASGGAYAQGTAITQSLQSPVVIANTTAGSATLTSVVASQAQWDALAVKQLVNLRTNDPGNSAGSPAYGYIVSWNQGAATITLATLASANSVATSFVAWNWLGIAQSLLREQVIYASPVGASSWPWSNTSGVFCTYAFDGAGYFQRSAGVPDMERAWAMKYPHASTAAMSVVPRLGTSEPAMESPYWPGGTLNFFYDDDATEPQDNIFTEPFEFISSKPFAFSQQVGNDFDANLARSTDDGAVNRIAWSKFLQPEAAPLLQYNDLGDSNEPILRVVATSDRLWIFKSDGLWSVYGDSPDSLVFQLVDPTCRLYANTAATATPANAANAAPWITRLGNEVFAWTQRGIFSISSQGVQRIDDAIMTDVAKYTPSPLALIGGLYASSSLYDNIVVFGATDITNIQPTLTSGVRYVFHVPSRTWSTWSLVTPLISFLTGSGNTDDGSLLLGSIWGFAKYNDTPRLDYVDTGGSQLPVQRGDIMVGPGAPTYSIVSVAGVTAVYSSSFLLELIPGCVLAQGGAYFMVMAASEGDLTLDRAGLTPGAVAAYFPPTATITYAATTMGAPATSKAFAKAYFGFQAMRGGLTFSDSYRVRGKTDVETLVEYFPETETPGTLDHAIGLDADREFECMRDVPTNQTLGTGLEVTLSIAQAAMYFAIDALTVTYEVDGDTIGGRS